MACGGTEITSVILIKLATVCNILSLALPYWAVVGSDNAGLFQACHNGQCYPYASYSGQYYHSSGYNMAIGGLVVAIILNAIALIFNLVFVCSSNSKSVSMMNASMGLSIASGILIAILWGVWMIIFLAIGGGLFSYLGASFWLCLVAPIFNFIHAGFCPGVKRNAQGANPPTQFQNPIIVGVPQTTTYVTHYPEAGSVPMQQPVGQGYSYGGQPTPPPSYPQVAMKI